MNMAQPACPSGRAIYMEISPTENLQRIHRKFVVGEGDLHTIVKKNRPIERSISMGLLVLTNNLLVDYTDSFIYTKS